MDPFTAQFDEPSEFDNVTFLGGADDEEVMSTFFNNNNNNSASAQASASEVTLASVKATPASKSNVLSTLRAHAKLAGADEFFEVLDSAPKAKAALERQISEGHKVAIFAPTNQAMAQFHQDSKMALKRAANRSVRENFASQHMSMNLHSQIAEARMNGHENPAFPAVNASLHMTFNEHDDGSAHAVALLKQGDNGEPIKRASANTDTMFSYKGNTLHVVDTPLVG